MPHHSKLPSAVATLISDAILEGRSNEEICEHIWSTKRHVRTAFSGRGGRIRFNSTVTRLRAALNNTEEIVNVALTQLPPIAENYSAPFPAALTSTFSLLSATCQTLLALARTIPFARPGSDHFTTDPYRQRSIVLNSNTTAHHPLLDALDLSSYYDLVYNLAQPALAHRNITVKIYYTVTFLNLLPIAPPRTRARPTTPLSGMDPHADEATAFCAIVLSLNGDGAQPALYFVPSTECIVRLPLTTGQLAFINRGCVHGVEFLARTSERWTLNTFLYSDPNPPSADAPPRRLLRNPSALGL